MCIANIAAASRVWRNINVGHHLHGLHSYLVARDRAASVTIDNTVTVHRDRDAIYEGTSHLRTRWGD
jgi:hypothetical protein